MAEKPKARKPRAKKPEVRVKEENVRQFKVKVANNRYEEFTFTPGPQAGPTDSYGEKTKAVEAGVVAALAPCGTIVYFKIDDIKELVSKL